MALTAECTAGVHFRCYGETPKGAGCTCACHAIPLALTGQQIVAIQEVATLLLRLLQDRPDLVVTRATIRDLRGLAHLDDMPAMDSEQAIQEPADAAGAGKGTR